MLRTAVLISTNIIFDAMTLTYDKEEIMDVL